MIVGNYDVKKQTYYEDTPLVAWLRAHPLLKSNPTMGFVRTDLDVIWYNYLLGFLMLIEEKSHGATLVGSQRSTLALLHQGACWAFRDPDFLFQNVEPLYPRPAKNYYCGLHTISFEHTGPTDGQISIDGVPVSLDTLTKFFQFKWTPDIQVYCDLKQKLLDCSSVTTLFAACEHIHREVPKEHPEYTLLAQLFSQKNREIAHKTTTLIGGKRR